MKKLLLFLPIAMFGTVCNATPNLPAHLICETQLSKYDPSVKESYDVNIVSEYSNGIVFSIDNESFVLIKRTEEDGSVYYYSDSPWYNFIIEGDTYKLGIPTNEPFARYTSCRKIG